MKIWNSTYCRPAHMSAGAAGRADVKAVVQLDKRSTNREVRLFGLAVRR